MAELALIVGLYDSLGLGCGTRFVVMRRCGGEVGQIRWLAALPELR